MLVYEVNCLVNTKMKETFMEWLPNHIREILAIDGFISAETYQMLEDDQLSARENSFGVSIRYYLKGQDTLNNYLDNHAEKLRKDGKDKFGDQLSAYRRVLLKSA
ncbi:DUF4286 family protein [Endozoicomonas gorgoniicola]|uniref:DUF4286 family protein n=1 Tax=Endozoicomonas gorgoniicola TaxID=1234144 RepID=A0ABT3MU29_9GAMM|nr:DUF4286 family protein [Endozoicomonas gorgoniicola]MCW7552882.1 DUF4286 family protein [Endozoicomonas gorgoniicola]